MVEDAQGLIDDNSLIPHIYLSVYLARKEEVELIEDQKKGCQNNFHFEKIVLLLNGAFILIEILIKKFEANPEKSTIISNGKCSDCGCETIIEITPTSGGFGLKGGALYKCSPDDYFAKCPECLKAGQHKKKENEKKKRIE